LHFARRQIITYETGVTNTTDLVGGSEYVENLTDEIEDGVKRILDEVEKTGGTPGAIETRWVQQQIHDAAYDHQRAVESGTQVVVVGSRVSRLRDGRWPQLCRAGSFRTEGEQQAHLDAFIVLFRDIDDLITSLVEQIAAADVF
jgi:hypothetical protein